MSRNCDNIFCDLLSETQHLIMSKVLCDWFRWYFYVADGAEVNGAQYCVFDVKMFKITSECELPYSKFSLGMYISIRCSVGNYILLC